MNPMPGAAGTPLRVPDVVVISGELPQEVLGKEVRERLRLTVDGSPATLRFLSHYFHLGRDARRAREEMQRDGLPFVSLNGVYLCQYLEARGFVAEHIPLVTPCRERLLALLALKPRAVVISTTFLPFAKQIDALAAFIKQHAPETTVIAGGVQVWKSYQHKLLLERGLIAEDIHAAVCEHNYLLDLERPSPVDVLVVSRRGEATLAALLDALRAGRDASGLANTARFRDGRWRLNAVTEEPYAEVKVDWTRVGLGPTRTFFPVQASQGCGFRCTFCDFCGLAPTVAERPVESILAEIGTVPETDGVRRVYFTDENLFTSRRRARAMCRAILASGLKVRWRAMIRISLVDAELAELMARSGCLEVLLGIESGDAELLRRMKKQVTPEQILAGVERLHRHGIHTKSTFIVGYPGETGETMQHTVELLNAYPTDGPAVHRYLFFTFAVLPLAEVASPASRRRYQLQGYGYHWKHATLTSEEAGPLLAAAQERLKPELSPSYVSEVPELAGLDVERLKRIYVLRNDLARRGREGAAPETASALWDELAAQFDSSCR